MSILWTGLSAMTSAGQERPAAFYPGSLHICIVDKHLVFQVKLMGDQNVRQAYGGSAFTALRSVMIFSLCGNMTTLSGKPASVSYHCRRLVSINQITFLFPASLTNT